MNNVPELNYNDVKSETVSIKGVKYTRYYYREKLDVLPEFIYHSYYDEDNGIFIDSDEQNDSLETTYQRKLKLEQLDNVSDG